jgi:hypothetical protein
MTFSGSSLHVIPLQAYFPEPVLPLDGSLSILSLIVAIFHRAALGNQE